MSPIVSVIVPTYRRPQLLNRCLQALLAQNLAPSAYEIIIVDDDPQSSATRELISEWQQRLYASRTFTATRKVSEVPVTGSSGQMQLEIAYLEQSQPMQLPLLTYLLAADTTGPAAARNLGWRAASGEIIAFTDDDCIPDPNWLVNGLAAFSGEVDGVSGRVLVPLPPHPTDHELNTTGLERSHFVTANCFYRRSALERIGGFDERFGTAWREDSDLFFSLHEQGFPLVYAPDALVVHPVRPDTWGSSIRQQRKSFFNALLYKKHPKLYRQYIQPGPPWHYYILGIALFAALAGLIRGNAWIGISGLFVWAFLYARFCYHRLKNTSHAPIHVAEMLVTSLAIPFLSIYWRLRGALHWKVFFL